MQINLTKTFPVGVYLELEQGQHTLTIMRLPGQCLHQDQIGETSVYIVFKRTISKPPCGGFYIIGISS